MIDIESLREDIARVRERGRQIVEISDLEGYNTMQATLTMLTDRVDNLQTLADTKGKQLQVRIFFYQNTVSGLKVNVDLQYINHISPVS